MAITINGSSNTITGLAVGGLPDGIVDTDMIAANAVTAVKRGAGAVLQVVYGTHDTSVVSSSGSYVDTGLSKSITPLQTGSNIYVQVHQHIMVNRDNDGAFGAIKIVQDSTDRFVNANTYQMGVFADGVSTVNLRFPLVMSSFHAHGVSAGTSTTYKTQMINHQTSNSGQIVSQQGGSTSTITIMEISA
tara:strand:- start:201 stop:767 length:567 start_codon:yes stop_codon:yes gene_type:complete